MNYKNHNPSPPPLTLRGGENIVPLLRGGDGGDRMGVCAKVM